MNERNFSENSRLLRENESTGRTENYKENIFFSGNSKSLRKQ